LNLTDKDQLVNFPSLLARVFKEAGLILIIGINLFLLFALLGYDPRDPGWSHLGYHPEVRNHAGSVGAWLADFSFSAVGFGAWLVPLLVVIPAVRFLFRRDRKLIDAVPYFILRSSGALLILLAVATLSATHIDNTSAQLPFSAGGLSGEALSDLTVDLFGVVGSSVLLFTLLLFSITLFIESSWGQLLERLGKGVVDAGDAVKNRAQAMTARRDEHKEYDDDAQYAELSDDQKRTQEGGVEVVRPEPVTAPLKAAAEHLYDALSRQPAVHRVEPKLEGGSATAKPAAANMTRVEPVLEMDVPPSHAQPAEADQRQLRESVPEPQNIQAGATESFDTQHQPQPYTSDEQTIRDSQPDGSSLATNTDTLETDVVEPFPLSAADPITPVEQRQTADVPPWESDQSSVPAHDEADDPLFSANVRDSRYDEYSSSDTLTDPMTDPLMDPLLSSASSSEASESATPETASYETPMAPEHTPEAAPVVPDVAASPEPVSSQQMEAPAAEENYTVDNSVESTAAHASEEPQKGLTIRPLSETHKPMQASDLGLEPGRGEPVVAPEPPKMRIPSLDQLDPPELNQSAGFSPEQLEFMSRLLEQKLKDFNVIAEVVEVNPGPVITRFEIQPAPGVKASKITNLAKDLARSMAVSSVRVVEVIAGKSVMGIEIPNESRQTVSLSEVLNSKPYLEAPSKLTLGLGNDIAGNPVVANLAKMPHLLVAGTTGSGKSVGVNAMLLSLLFKATPDEVRLMLVDPKMLELSIYDGIPHLLTPVITDMKDAAAGLRWCVGEMEERYRLMAKMGVRNIAGFNDKLEKARKEGNPLKDPLWNPEEYGMPADSPRPELKPLPYIVVVIDEFADMMMIVGKKVEELIARIAQKALAAGIHLILATQRPSVDVITGLIKANIPTRIAFQVSSKIDSRTILDQAGAEHLLGWGDMLYLPAGTSIPNRVHGAFVSDDEVHRVVEAWKKIGSPIFVEEILNAESGDSVITGSGGLFDDEQDPLYDEAVAFVTQTRKASISSVQRKLKVGYNRSARMIEAMEAAGVVSSPGGNGQREVLAPPPVKD